MISRGILGKVRDAVFGARDAVAVLAGLDVGSEVRALDVRTDPIDGRRFLQVQGEFVPVPPAPPPATTAFTYTQTGALSISVNTTDNYPITVGKVAFIQQITGGCEGDTSERGSVVEVYYFNGTVEKLYQRMYSNGFTQELFPSREKTIDGTVMTGVVGATIRVKRIRLSGSAQQVDFVVRGYEYTP